MSFDMNYDRDGNPLPNKQAIVEPEPVQDNSSLEAAATEESSPENQEVAAPEPIAKPEPESAQAKNFRTLRQQKEAVERERDEAVRIANEYAAKYQQPAEPEEDLGYNLADNDLAEGKHLTKLAKEVKKLKQQLEGYKQKTSEEVTEAKIKSQYPDFDKVVTSENVQALRDMYPEIAQTLNSSTDLYGKSVSAYTMIKRFGIVPEEHKYQADIDRAQKNAAKPKSLATISPQQGDSPLSRANAFANGLTEGLQKELWKEMSEIRRKS
jgi:hypothetical protein